MVNKNKSYRKIIFLFRECVLYLQSKPNDMTQTPISKAIAQLKEHKSNSYTTLYRLGCQNAIDILTDILPYEREVIEGAFHDGNHNEDFNSQSDYFTKTFTNNAD